MIPSVTIQVNVLLPTSNFVWSESMLYHTIASIVTRSTENLNNVDPRFTYTHTGSKPCGHRFVMKRACMESPYERTREELRGRHMGMCRKRKGEKMRLLVDAKRKDPQRRFGTDWMPSPTLPFNSVWKGPGKEEEPTEKADAHPRQPHALHDRSYNNSIASRSHGRCLWCCLCTEV